ncbi:hypothetical protein [Umezawaea sp. Da 62-37]|uniref:hypothetical protein n=1 Tax=Umezawaea sp. Da 62-37 TaxID=3075927 RepID=UPI0028F6EE1E|nr:hypothetical protein [Umezawaea sp. Da 62-37]WNV88356.1 hypothetical protein RM788_08685 [Umezawaea sp. Da 62-37]
MAAGSGFRLDPATAEVLRLNTLLEIVVRAVALQDQADEVIVACALPGDTSYEVARRGRKVAGEYGRLSGWADDLCADDAPESLPARVGGLVRYHLGMLDTAVKLAFPRYRTEGLERRRMAMTGLGEPARALRVQELALRSWIAELGGA